MTTTVVNVRDRVPFDVYIGRQTSQIGGRERSKWAENGLQTPHLVQSEQLNNDGRSDACNILRPDRTGVSCPMSESTIRLSTGDLDPTDPRRWTDRYNGRTEVERFWDSVERLPGNGCWEWRRWRLPKGYGLFRTRFPRLRILSHRYSWIITYGAIPDGLMVCHECDNPSCVRPDHLFLGTNLDNVADMVAKGRVRHGEAHHLHKATPQVQAQMFELLALGLSQREVGERLGVSQGLVSLVVTGKRRPEVV